MLRQYSRLSVLLATILFFLIVVSPNFLQSSPSRFGEASVAHLQGEELLGAKLSEAFGSDHDETKHDESEQSTPEQPEPQDQSGPPAAKVETDVQSPSRPENTNGEPILDPDSWMPKADESGPQEEETKEEITKIIVMGKMSSEDTNWVSEVMTDWQNAIYAVDLPRGVESPTGHRTTMNKAKEVMPYLTYITDNYPDFP